MPIHNFGGCDRTGVLLDDLLVAEDLAAVETTSAASHAAAAAGAVSPHPLPSHSSKSMEMRKPPHPDSPGADGASVLMAHPVAAPLKGDTTMDISTENALAHGHR